MDSVDLKLLASCLQPDWDLRLCVNLLSYTTSGSDRHGNLKVRMLNSLALDYIHADIHLVVSLCVQFISNSKGVVLTKAFCAFAPLYVLRTCSLSKAGVVCLLGPEILSVILTSSLSNTLKLINKAWRLLVV